MAVEQQYLVLLLLMLQDHALQNLQIWKQGDLFFLTLTVVTGAMLRPVFLSAFYDIMVAIYHMEAAVLIKLLHHPERIAV